MAACDLMVSDIYHTRHGQPSHFLARRGLSIWIDLDQLADANRQSCFFSVGRFNVLSFFESDHGPNFEMFGLNQSKPDSLIQAFNFIKKYAIKT